MQMKKRVLSALLALCMVCSLVGAAWAVIPQVSAAVTGVTIVNSIETDGRFTAQLTGSLNSGQTAVYTWERSSNGSDYDKIAYTKVTGEDYNMAGENGTSAATWVNVALDSEVADAADSQRYWYRVIVQILDSEGNVVGGPHTATTQVPYYVQLQNGSFEIPAVGNDEHKINIETGDDTNRNYFSTEGLVWKTTATDHLIEFVGAGSESTNDWHGINYCPTDSIYTTSNQCVELNAEQASALYQDVMTVPGSTMRWSLMHNGRTRNNNYVGYGDRYNQNNPASDTMYVLIMSTTMADEMGINTQSEVEAAIEAIQRGDPKYAGASVATIEYQWYWTRESGRYSLHVYDEATEQWMTYAPGRDGKVQTVWKYHSGDYTVPSDQYLTRYFFVAGETELGRNTGSDTPPYSVGNHIDNVHFSTDLPPAAPGTVSLEIVKHITGDLTEEDFETLQDKLSFTVNYGGTTVPVSGSAMSWTGTEGNYTGTYAIQNIPLPANDSLSYTITEDAASAAMTGYTLTTSETSTTGTLSDGQVGVATFTNNYAKIAGSLAVTKIVEDYVPGEDYAVTINVVNSEGEPAGTATLSDFTANDDAYQATYTFTDLPADTYTVTETVNGVLDGYAQTSTVIVGDASSTYDPYNPPQVVITAGQTQNVTFTNSYDVDVTVEPVTPDIRKYVDDKEDGTYDLSLDVTGTTVKDTKKLNVLYILDESFSMMWDMNGTFPYSEISSSTNSNASKFGPNPGGDNKETEANEKGVPVGIEIQYSYERYQAATSAINLLNETLATNDNLEVQYALVEFAKTAPKTTGWSNNNDFTLPVAEYETFESGTNYVAAFNSAKTLLKTAPAGAETIVIFITDGDPNRSTVDGANTDNNVENCINAAKNYIKDLNCDRFYAIGMSEDVTEGNLDKLIDVEGWNATASVFQGNSTMELAQEFANMAAEITGSVTQDVTIMDELSEYAELVNSNASPVITITDANGKPVSVASNNDLTVDSSGIAMQTFTFSDRTYINASSATTQTLIYHYYPAGQYNNNTHPVITLEFPEDYQLTQDWTYTITLQIQPTDAAYDEYARNIAENKNGYDGNTGDPNTDVPGSDESTWTSSGKDGFNSNTKADLTYTNGDGEEETADYPDPVIQVKFLDLVVAKQVTGNMGDTTRDFDFTLQLNRGNTYYTNTLIAGNSTLTATNNAYAFRLKNGESITIQVPARYAAQVAETTTNLGYTVYAGYDETDADKNSEGDYSYIKTTENANPVRITSLDQGYTVLFTNYRQVSTPTGLTDDNNLPFTLMITAAGLAGIALIATILVRRQRRRRQE